ARLPAVARRAVGNGHSGADDTGCGRTRRTAALLLGPAPADQPGRAGRSPSTGQRSRITVTTACLMVPATTSTTTLEDREEVQCTAAPKRVMPVPQGDRARPGPRQRPLQCVGDREVQERHRLSMYSGR